jgi:hypothetical protein
MFQATSECDLLLKGGLVFDGDMRLVGIVYSHAGSPKAVRISYIRRMLAEVFIFLLQTHVIPIVSLNLMDIALSYKFCLNKMTIRFGI